MGQLIDVTSFRHRFNGEARGHLDPAWYFPDYDPRGSSYGTRDFSIKSGYPHIVYIHRDDFGGSFRKPKVSRLEVRKFIERHLPGDVITSLIDKTYHDSGEGKWSSYGHTVHHYYIAFHFETSEECTIFSLKFSEVVVVAMSLKHPRDED